MSERGFAWKYCSNLIKNNATSVTIIPATLVVWLIRLSRSTTFQFIDVLPIVLLVLYMIIVLYDQYQTTKAIVGPVCVPYLIITWKSREYAEVVAKLVERVLRHAGIKLGRIFESFMISQTDWQYHSEKETEDTQWKQLTADIGTHFLRLTKRITTDACYHFFFVTPPAVALGVGATIGREMLFNAYQFFGSSYVRVVDMVKYCGEDSYHYLYTQLDKYEEITVERKDVSNARITALILNFVGHRLSPIHETIEGPYNELVVRHKKFKGHLPSQYDWMKLAHEITSLILVENDHMQELHLFLGIPSTLAFVIGTVLGRHSPIRVYHHDKKRGKYIMVFRLNEL